MIVSTKKLQMLTADYVTLSFILHMPSLNRLAPYSTISLLVYVYPLTLNPWFIIYATHLYTNHHPKILHLYSLPTSITMGNAQIPFKNSVKNLGFTLDCHLTINAHVSNIARTCYFELRRLASIRRFLTSTATATLVSAFVL